MSAAAQSRQLRMAQPLSDEELDELYRFLISDRTSDETMALDTLDGFLTAIAAGPVTIPPSRWLPRIWGPTEEHAPEFETQEQAERILELVLRHMNGIVEALDGDPDSFEPMMDTRGYEGREYLDGEMWAHGFMQGIALCRADWDPLLADPARREALRPIRLLGADDLTAEEEPLIETPAQREELSRMLQASLASIYRFWLPHREAEHERQLASRMKRREPKAGRNDPCPCGSGKKFKRCCGSGTALQ